MIFKIRAAVETPEVMAKRAAWLVFILEDWGFGSGTGVANKGGHIFVITRPTKKTRGAALEISRIFGSKLRPYLSKPSREERDEMFTMSARASVEFKEANLNN